MLKKLKYRLARTATVMEYYDYHKHAVEHLTQWPLKHTHPHFVALRIANASMRELQQYLIPELQRRGLK